MASENRWQFCISLEHSNVQKVPSLSNTNLHQQHSLFYNSISQYFSNHLPQNIKVPQSNLKNSTKEQFDGAITNFTMPLLS